MKTRLGALPYIYPIPITLVGAQVDERANFTTIGDLGLLGINPALVCISSHRQHHINRGILDNQTFSINFPTTEMLAQVDYCGLVSGREVDKGALFEVFYGDLENTPLIMACPVNLECRVVKEFSIQHRQVFVGEVIQTHVSTDFIQEMGERKAIADLTRLDPILYALDNRYYRIGGAIGQGYREGRQLLQDADPSSG